MKATPLVAITVIALSSSACGQQDVEKRLTDLEKRVNALEKASPLTSLLNAASPPPAVETKSPLQLISWDAHLNRGEYSNCNYKITLTLKNNSDKDIKLIE